jgi:serine/threonine protein kinase
VNHPNIIRVYDVKINATEVKPSGKKKKKTFIVLELAEGGELFDYVAQSGPYDDSTCRYYFNQLLGAVATLHKLGYAHRDLKPENLLYDKEF